jgi:hypothetical protein
MECQSQTKNRGAATFIAAPLFLPLELNRKRTYEIGLIVVPYLALITPIRSLAMRMCAAAVG